MLKFYLRLLVIPDNTWKSSVEHDKVAACKRKAYYCEFNWRKVGRRRIAVLKLKDCLNNRQKFHLL